MRLAAVLIAALTAGACSAPADSKPEGDIQRGKTAIEQNGCGVCHRIPGIPNADGTIGLPLERLGAREKLNSGVAATPDNIVKWIVDPKAMKPETEMPDLDINEATAKDITAYLLSLK
jgi:cytochrome c2